MMKAVIRSWFRHFDRRETEREIEEQVCLHLELLTQALLQQNMSAKDAKAAALKQFGDVEQIKAQCVTISNRNHPALRALKAFLILVFVVGVLFRVLGTELHVTRVGDISIIVAVLGRLFLYVRSMNPSSFLSNPDRTPLRLNDEPIRAYDQRMRTPVERLIFDK